MSYRKFSAQEYNEKQLKRIESFTRRIDLIYYSAIIEATQIAVNVAVDTEKPFAFDEYSQTTERVESLFRRMALDMLFTIELGQDEAWNYSFEKNDTLVDFMFSNPIQADDTTPSLTPPPRYKARNQEALTAFKERTIDGLNLSDRVWRYTGQFKTELEMAIDVGLGEGKSAQQMSRDIRRYLNEPDNLFRKVRNKRGNLALSKAAKAYHPGQGVYRSSYKNAMRLTRTEINAAYREADHVRYQTLDFVVGFEVRRSNNPGDCDVCAKLKGRYPKTFKFVGWHPQCRCHVVSIMATPDELMELNRRMLNNESTDDFRSVNEVTDLPDNFRQWVDDNQKRLEKAPNTPIFIRDNFTGKDFSKRTFTVSEPVKRAVQGIDMSKLIKGDTPTNAEMKAVIMEFAKQHPEHFSSGLESVSILKSKSYMMQHSRLYNSSTNQWASQSSISLSTHSFSIGGQLFNPTEELRGAFAGMKANTPLTFNQEYAVEALWHEILHAKSATPPRKLNQFRLERMETLNQFIARHTYDDFLTAFDTKAIHKQQVLDSGYGYKSWVAGFRNELKRIGIAEDKAVKDLMPVLMGDYSEILTKVKAYLANPQ